MRAYCDTGFPSGQHVSSSRAYIAVGGQRWNLGVRSALHKERRLSSIATLPPVLRAWIRARRTKASHSPCVP